VLALPTSRRGRRFGQLMVGLAIYGFGIGLMVRSDLGLNPWQVFHQGVSIQTGLTMGTITIMTGGLVLLGWIPLGERVGAGTILNVATIGPTLDLTLWLVDRPDALWVRITYLVVGTVLVGLATGLYVGAGLGPGPRDGLMTGLARKGWSIGWARTVIEVTVLALGWLLGGTVGAGTVLFALAIGPLTQLFLPRLTVRPTA
jgi:uncharacterized membrane protein YczE